MGFFSSLDDAPASAAEAPAPQDIAPALAPLLVNAPLTLPEPHQAAPRKGRKLAAVADSVPVEIPAPADHDRPIGPMAPLDLGLHEDVPAWIYHADMLHPEPTLSSSVCETIYSRTPKHARHEHPRLNPEHEARDGSAAMALGSVVHELVLGRGAGFDVLDFDDFRTKAAGAARDASIAAGRTPVLRETMEMAERIAAEALDEIRARPDCADFFDEGARSEVMLLWRDAGGPLCRAMLDRLTPRATIYDVKVSGLDQGDATMGRQMEDGYALRSRFYIRGAEATFPTMAGRFRFVWVFVEPKAPHAVRIVEADGRTRDLGDRMAALGIERWRHAMASGDWRAHPRQVETVGVTDWAEKRVMEREEADPAAKRMVVSNRAQVAAPEPPDSVIYGEGRVLLPREVAA